MKIEKKTFDKVVLLLFFCSVYPVVFKQINPIFGYPLSISTLLYSLINILNKPFIQISKNRKLFLSSLSIYFVWLIIISLLSQRAIFFLSSFQFLSVIIMLIFAYSIDEDNELREDLANSFAIMLILAVISLVLAFIFRPNPFLEFNHSNNDAVSRLVFFTFAPIYMKWNGFMRFAGIFNEPGTLSSYTLFIIAAILPLKNKLKRTKLVLVSLSILNLSFGYIIAFITFLGVFAARFFGDLLLYFKVKRDFFKSFLIVSAIIIFTYFAISQVMPLYLEMRLERFNNITEESRFNGFLNDLKIFIDNPFFGEVFNKTWLIRGNNPMSSLARFGIFGSIFYYLPFITFLGFIWNKNNNSKTLRIAIILSLLTLFIHRPEIVYPSIMLVAGILIE